RSPFYAVRPDGYRHARLFYATSYYKDGGDSLIGVESHDGDSEFMVFYVSWLSDTTWQLDHVYMSAHYKTACDEGMDYPATMLEWYAAGGGRPLIHVAEQKHGSYPTSAVCESGCFYQDSCGDVQREDWGVRPDSDLGLASKPIIDDTIAGGNHEYY